MADPGGGGGGGGGWGSSRPRDKGGAVSKKFSALQASVWSKNKGRGGPPGPLPWIRQ